MLLADFDDDIALLILNQLVPKDLVSLQLTCRWGKEIARQDSLWKEICADRFKTWNTHLFPASPDNQEPGDTGLFSTILSWTQKIDESVQHAQITLPCPGGLGRLPV